MEEVIVYLVIGAAIILNIYNNYQKQKQKDEKRDLNKPVSPSFPSTRPSADVPGRRPLVITGQPAAKKKSVREEREEIYKEKEVKKASPFGRYETLESTSETVRLLDTLDMDIHKYATPEGFEEEISIEEMEMEKKPGGYARKEGFALFETRDDLVKAILYKEVLDRKY